MAQVQGATGAIDVDRSVQYPVNVGQCERCGLFRTWERRILNPKTGKQMPAHVIEDRYLTNGGECPFWYIPTKIKYPVITTGGWYSTAKKTRKRKKGNDQF